MFNCKSCGILTPIKKNSMSKYCSNNCQRQFEYEKRVEAWLLGEDTGHMGKGLQIKNFVRRWLFEKRGAKCEQCGWDKTHPSDGKPLVEIDHIDGDASNCTPLNLRVLCPNCHSMTPTYRARNPKSSRNRNAPLA